MAQLKKRQPCKSPPCRIVRDCRYLRTYIFDIQDTITEMEHQLRGRN